MFRYISAVTIAAALGAGAATAQNLDQQMKTTKLAIGLANILASEEYCGLSFNADAVSNWVDENVDPAQMDFTPQVDLYMMGVSQTLAAKTATQKVAHCRVIERTGRHYQFIN